MYCQNCGKEVSGNYCSNCGAAVITAPSGNDTPKSDPAPAAAASNGSAENVPPVESAASTADITSPVGVDPASASASAKSSDFKIKIISYIIVFILVFGISFGVVHFLFGGKEKEEQHPTFIDNKVAAEIALEDYVKYPDTLELSFYEEDWQFVTNDNKRVKMESTFTCQNAFGVPERHSFVLILTYSDDYENFTINDLTIDKEEYI